MSQREVEILVNDVISKLQIGLANPEKNKESIKQIYEMFMKNPLYKDVKKALLKDSRFKEMKHEIKELEKEPKDNKKLVKRVAAYGITGALVLCGGCEMLKQNKVSLNNTNGDTITDLETKEYRPIPEVEVAYDELFDANQPEERINRISNFLTEARELGFDEEYFTIEQLNDVYTILNLSSLDPREFAALDLNNKNVELMMENLADFGAAVGQNVLISNSKEHLNIASLISNKQDAEYMETLEGLLYQYNDENSNKETLAQEITNLIWEKTVQKQTVGNATQLIGYYLGYQGHELTTNNKKQILGNKTQFHEIYSSTGCNVAAVLEGKKESQFSESYIDTKKALEDFMNLTMKYENELTYGLQIEQTIYENIKDVKVGTLKDFNYYIHKYSPSFSTTTSNVNKVTEKDKENMVKDENGNTVIKGEHVGPSKEQQTADANALSALKTEASSAAVRKAEADAKTGSYNESIPAQYQSVSAEYLESYREAYSEYKALYDSMVKEPTENEIVKEEIVENVDSNKEEPKPEVENKPSEPTNDVIDESGVDFGNSSEIVTDEELISPDELPADAEIMDETLAISNLQQLANAIRNTSSGVQAEVTQDKALKLTFTI